MQQNNSKKSNQSDIEFNFIEIVRILLNSKRLIILITIAVGAIGWIYSLYFNPAQPPNFESSSVMEIGSYKAPVEKDNSKNYKWLCQEHIKLFNKKWNY